METDNQLLLFLKHLIGVEVTIKDGNGEYRGVVHDACLTERGPELDLWVPQPPNPTPPTLKRVTPLNCKEIEIPSLVAESLKRDSEICNYNSEPGIRSLEKWINDDPQSIGGLEDWNGNPEWDQFEVNHKLFGITSTIHQDYEKTYTTELDKNSTFYKSREERAQKIAQAITWEPATNSHLKEERNQSTEGEDYNEEERYSSVIREELPPAPPTNPTTPPTVPPKNQKDPQSQPQESAEKQELQLNPNAKEFTPGSHFQPLPTSHSPSPPISTSHSQHSPTSGSERSQDGRGTMERRNVDKLNLQSILAIYNKAQQINDLKDRPSGKTPEMVSHKWIGNKSPNHSWRTYIPKPTQHYYYYPPYYSNPYHVVPTTPMLSPPSMPLPSQTLPLPYVYTPIPPQFPSPKTRPTHGGGRGIPKEGKDNAKGNLSANASHNFQPATRGKPQSHGNGGKDQGQSGGRGRGSHV